MNLVVYVEKLILWMPEVIAISDALPLSSPLLVKSNNNVSPSTMSLQPPKYSRIKSTEVQNVQLLQSLKRGVSPVKLLPSLLKQIILRRCKAYNKRWSYKV
mmetsp:Transcript_27860/g.40735  ORF Transcript_27860/g.40735 Transcript_27860/m.40735 type:complete len:101 (-) Transcript_27860:1021-1323(-)